MMSLIKLSCNDQELSIVSAPIVASGGVEETQIEVVFNDTWNGYAKTAIFYRSEEEVYHVVLDSENKCIVPFEVTTNDGKLYIGVFGIKGTSRLTSSIVCYNVVKGAFIEGQEPSEPTPNIYTQIMDQYEKIIAAYDNIFAKLNEIIVDTCLQGVINQANDSQLVKFWFGTKAEYDALETKEDLTVYVITNDTAPCYSFTEEEVTNLQELSKNKEDIDDAIKTSKEMTFSEASQVSKVGLYSIFLAHGTIGSGEETYHNEVMYIHDTTQTMNGRLCYYNPSSQMIVGNSGYSIVKTHLLISK